MEQICSRRIMMRQSGKRQQMQHTRSLMDLYQSYHSDDNDLYDNYYGITQEKWNSELIWTTGSKGRFIMSADTCPTSVAGSLLGDLSGLLSNKWMPIQWQRQVGFLLQVMNQTVVL